MYYVVKKENTFGKFPLTLHPTGQYCKKINGKLYYFGSDKKQALEKYLSQASYLHSNKEKTQQKAGGEMTLKELCNLYLQYQGVPGTTDPMPQPVQVLEFTSFSHEQVLTSPVTFQWQPCTDPAANLIWVGMENQDTGEDYDDNIFDVSATGSDQPVD